MLKVSFKDFITEAKVSAGNLNKVADIFKRIIQKNLSTKLYRYGGEKGMVEIKNGVGILYFFSDTRAVRINYVKGEIVSLSFWKRFSLGKLADFTIDLGGIGLTQAGKTLIDILRNPKVGVLQTYGDLVEELLGEAKRTSPQEFSLLVQNGVPGNVQMNRVPWDMLTAIAIQAGVQIPTVIRSKKIGKNEFDLTSFIDGTAKDATTPASKTEPQYYVKVTGQDPITKKFFSTKEDATAQKILAAVKAGINAPDTKTVDKALKNPNDLFRIMADLVDIVIMGRRNGLVVYGGPGTGKCAAPEELITVRVKA